MGQRIVRRKRCERQCSANGLFQPAGVAQCPDQAMMRLNVSRIGINGGAEGLGRFIGQPVSEQVEAALVVRFCASVAGRGHGWS